LSLELEDGGVDDAEAECGDSAVGQVAINAYDDMVLRQSELYQLAALMELVPNRHVGTLVQQHQLVQIAVFAGAVDAHGELLDGAANVANPEQLERLTFVETFEKGRLEPILEHELH